MNGFPKEQGLYHPDYEQDSCGVGFVANVGGIKSNEIVVNGLEVLKNLSHRGATGADVETGDGAGITIQIPHEFFKDELVKEDITLPNEGEYGVGMVFLPQEPNTRYYCEGVFERIIKEEGQELIAWRIVPADEKACGFSALNTKPIIKQIFIKIKDGNQAEVEKKLYIIRKRVEKEIINGANPYTESFYICSLSSKTIVYKGQFLAHQIEDFFLN